MKTVVVLFILTMSGFSSFSQDYDSLKQQILKMEISIDNISTNMARAHHEFRQGTILLVIGILVTGVYIHSVHQDLEREILLPIGGALTLTGGAMQINSHRHIGKGKE